MAQVSCFQQSPSKNPCIQEKQERKNLNNESLTLPIRGFLYKGLMVSVKCQSFYFLNYPFFLYFHSETSLQSLCIHLCLSIIQRHVSTCQKYSCSRCSCESRKTMREMDNLNRAQNSTIHEADRRDDEFKASLHYVASSSPVGDIVRPCLNNKSDK